MAEPSGLHDIRFRCLEIALALPQADAEQLVGWAARLEAYVTGADAKTPPERPGAAEALFSRALEGTFRTTESFIGDIEAEPPAEAAFSPEELADIDRAMAAIVAAEPPSPRSELLDEAQTDTGVRQRWRSTTVDDADEGLFVVTTVSGEVQLWSGGEERIRLARLTPAAAFHIGRLLLAGAEQSGRPSEGDDAP